MTAALLLYYALLLLWLPLLWPACRARGGRRIWLLAVAAAGLLATAHEIRMVFWTTAAIRLDILLISVALGGLYVSAAIVLWLSGRRKTAAAFGLAIALIGAGMGYEWIALGRESARLTANFHARNALLFEAKFRDRETYETVFGPFAGARAGAFPVGHWRAEGTSRHRRIIINAGGRIWLFNSCGNNECDFASRATWLQRSPQVTPGRWHATLRPRAGAPLALRLDRLPSGGLSLSARGVTERFFKAPPPIAAQPPARRLSFVGRFAKLGCRGAHAQVDQLWLWRGGDRLFAVGIFSVLVAGRRADFVSPEVLGAAVRESGGWTFRWRHHGKSRAATLEIQGDRVILHRPGRGKTPERHVLGPTAIFSDTAIDLAPLTSEDDWSHWFRIVLTGHFTSGDIPAC